MGAHAADRQDRAALLEQNEWDLWPVDCRFCAQKLACFQRVGGRHYLKLVDRWLKCRAVDVSAHAKNQVAAQPGGQAREEQTSRRETEAQGTSLGPPGKQRAEHE